MIIAGNHSKDTAPTSETLPNPYAPRNEGEQFALTQSQLDEAYLANDLHRTSQNPGEKLRSEDAIAKVGAAIIEASESPESTSK